MKTVWILTSSVNDYNQYGEYFEMAFIEKPTATELDKLGYHGEHLLKGGGRVGNEDVWYHLKEISF